MKAVVVSLAAGMIVGALSIPSSPANDVDCGAAVLPACPPAKAPQTQTADDSAKDTCVTPTAPGLGEDSAATETPPISR